ncbi:MAG: alpha/beta fold hydrolase [Anaeromyxobacter sp.]
MRSQPRTLAFPARDGVPLEGDLFLPDGPPAGAVLVAGAMGVARRYYRPFAAHLAGRGLAALTLDLRGMGGSRRGSLRGLEATLHGWGELDLAGGLDALAREAPGAPLLWVGHSAGGQLLGLLDPSPVRAALLVGAQNGHWRHWRGWRRAAMAGFWWVGLPAAVAAFGYLPMRLAGQGEDVPAGVAREWAAWGRRREYIGVYAQARGGLGFARWGGVLRSIAVADDRYAPPPSVHALAAAYRAARVEVVDVTPASIGARRVGHFGFFRPAFEEALWRPASDWLLAQAGADAVASRPA